MAPNAGFDDQPSLVHRRVERPILFLGGPCHGELRAMQEAPWQLALPTLRDGLKALTRYELVWWRDAPDAEPLPVYRYKDTLW